MVRSLRPLRQKRSEEPGIRLPELPLPEVFPVEADFSEFPGLVRLFTGHSLQYGVLAVYRFDLPDAGNFDRLAASLEAQGFERGTTPLRMAASGLRRATSSGSIFMAKTARISGRSAAVPRSAC